MLNHYESGLQMEVQQGRSDSVCPAVLLGQERPLPWALCFRGPGHVPFSENQRYEPTEKSPSSNLPSGDPRPQGLSAQASSSPFSEPICEGYRWSLAAEAGMSPKMSIRSCRAKDGKKGHSVHATALGCGTPRSSIVNSKFTFLAFMQVYLSRTNIFI